LSENQIQNPYKDESGKPLLRNSVVTYIDILGYQDQVKNAVDAGRGKAILLDLRKAFDETYHHIKDESEVSHPHWLVKGFTDNIVIGYPVFQDAEPEMGYMFSNLCTFQLMMIIHGFFIRGGMAIDLFHKAQEINSADFHVWKKLGLTLYDGEYYPEALEAFQRAAELTKGGAWVIVWQGHILDILGRREEAVQRYREALEIGEGINSTHDQYHMKISRQWVEDRLKTPYRRK